MFSSPAPHHHHSLRVNSRRAFSLAIIVIIIIIIIIITCGEQGWSSGESTRLPPMWRGFLFRRRAICGLTFCSFSPLLREVFLRVSQVVSSLRKPTFANSNSIRNQVDELPLSGCVASKSLLFSFVHRQSSTTTSFISLNENEPTGSTEEGDWCLLTIGFFTV